MNKKQYPHSPGMRGKYGETASKRKPKTSRAAKTAADVCGTATLRRGWHFQKKLSAFCGFNIVLFYNGSSST